MADDQQTDDSDRAPEVVLEMWTLYRSPLDRPGLYVARRYEVVRGMAEPLATLDEITGVAVYDVTERLMPHVRDKHFVERDPSDHPTVVGTWL